MLFFFFFFGFADSIQRENVDGGGGGQAGIYTGHEIKRVKTMLTRDKLMYRIIGKYLRKIYKIFVAVARC